MKIAIGADHGGFDLKEHVRARLTDAGHELVDVGTHTSDSVDYPDFAEEAARLVASGRADRAVIACGSGVGVAIVANKVPGVRAVNAHNAAEAELARQHNDVNVVTLSGRTLTTDQADGIVEAFLLADFEGGRHERRVAKIAQIDGSA